MQSAEPMSSPCTTGYRPACRPPTTRPDGDGHSRNSRRSSRRAGRVRAISAPIGLPELSRPIAWALVGTVDARLDCAYLPLVMSIPAAQLEEHRTALTGHCYRTMGSVIGIDDG